MCMASPNQIQWSNPLSLALKCTPQLIPGGFCCFTARAANSPSNLTGMGPAVIWMCRFLQPVLIDGGRSSFLCRLSSSIRRPGCKYPHRVCIVYLWMQPFVFCKLSGNVSSGHPQLPLLQPPSRTSSDPSFD